MASPICLKIGFKKFNFIGLHRLERCISMTNMINIFEIIFFKVVKIFKEYNGNRSIDLKSGKIIGQEIICIRISKRIS